jgi:hypothetical protein
MVFAGPKRPLGCGSTSIFGTARHQLQQDLVSSRVAQFWSKAQTLARATLAAGLASLVAECSAVWPENGALQAYSEQQSSLQCHGAKASLPETLRRVGKRR